jgi:hypothetical protein
MACRHRCSWNEVTEKRLDHTREIDSTPLFSSRNYQNVLILFLQAGGRGYHKPNKGPGSLFHKFCGIS